MDRIPSEGRISLKCYHSAVLSAEATVTHGLTSWFEHLVWCEHLVVRTLGRLSA